MSPGLDLRAFRSASERKTNKNMNSYVTISRPEPQVVLYSLAASRHNYRCTCEKVKRSSPASSGGDHEVIPSCVHVNLSTAFREKAGNANWLLMITFAAIIIGQLVAAMRGSAELARNRHAINTSRNISFKDHFVMQIAALLKGSSTDRSCASNQFELTNQSARRLPE